MVFVYTAMGVLCVEHANVLELCYIELLSGDGSPYSIISDYITTPEKSIILKLTVQNISSCKQVREFTVAYFPPEADQVVCDKLRYCALKADEPNEFGATCSYKCPCVGNQCVLALVVIPLFKTNTTFCEVEVYKGISDFP